MAYYKVTRFPMDERPDSLHEIMVETQKERQTIQAQPYRTTQLVFPNPKIKPDLVKTKLTGRKITTYRPLDQRTVVANLNENTALVHRQQYNNPKSLYSDQNVQEAIYVQTGINYTHPQQQQQQYAPAPLPTYQQYQRPLQQQRQPPASSHSLGPPVHRTPDAVPDFKPQNSPTYRAILEEEGPGTPMPAPAPQKAPPQKYAHNTAPTYHLNSVGMPHDRIAQSHSFKRLMYNVMGEF